MNLRVLVVAVQPTGHLRHKPIAVFVEIGRNERPDPDSASPDPSPGRIERCGDQEVWVAVSLNVFSDSDGAPQLGTARGAVQAMVRFSHRDGA